MTDIEPAARLMLPRKPGGRPAEVIADLAMCDEAITAYVAAKTAIIAARAALDAARLLDEPDPEPEPAPEQPAGEATMTLAGMMTALGPMSVPQLRAVIMSAWAGAPAAAEQAIADVSDDTPAKNDPGYPDVSGGGVPFPATPFPPQEPALAAVDASEPSFVGRIVASIHDDSPCPVTGRVVGQVDEEWVDVAWGDQRDADYPATSREALDELRPVGKQPSVSDGVRARMVAEMRTRPGRPHGGGRAQMAAQDALDEQVVDAMIATGWAHDPDGDPADLQSFIALRSETLAGSAS